MIGWRFNSRHDDKEGLQRSIDELHLYSCLCLIRRSWPGWVTGWQRDRRFLIGPTHYSSSEHQLGAPHSRQDQLAKHINVDHRMEGSAGESGGAATLESTTTAATTVSSRPCCWCSRKTRKCIVPEPPFCVASWRRRPRFGCTVPVLSPWQGSSAGAGGDGKMRHRITLILTLVHFQGQV